MLECYVSFVILEAKLTPWQKQAWQKNSEGVSDEAWFVKNIYLRENLFLEENFEQNLISSQIFILMDVANRFSWIST